MSNIPGMPWIPPGVYGHVPDHSIFEYKESKIIIKGNTISVYGDTIHIAIALTNTFLDNNYSGWISQDCGGTIRINSDILLRQYSLEWISYKPAPDIWYKIQEDFNKICKLRALL